MQNRGFLFIVALLFSVTVACGGFGWWAGRTGAQRLAQLEKRIITGTPVGLPGNIRFGQRVRLYMGAEIKDDPAFTIVAGRVHRGGVLDHPMMTLEQSEVFSGGGAAGPLLYRFVGDRIVEAGLEAPVLFVQRDNKIHFGTEPDAPVAFTFNGTHIYRGNTDYNRILATSNTVVNDPDLMKLVSLVLYMETLE